MNVLGLFSIIVIFGTLIFQMFFFGHIIGPLVFSVVAALLVRRGISDQNGTESADRQEIGIRGRVDQVALSVTAFIITSNLFYSWASSFGLYHSWIIDKNILVMLHIGLGLVFGICFSFPLRRQVPIMYLVIYGLVMVFISIECTPELAMGAIVLNGFILIFGYRIKNNRPLYTMSIFVVVSNLLYFLLPKMQGEGINFIIKVANQFGSITQITLVIHLSRLVISVIIGFSLTTIAKHMLFSNARDSYRQSPFIANLLTVIILSILCAKLLYYRTQQYRFTFVLDPPEGSPLNLYSLPNSESLVILSLTEPQVLWELGEPKNGFSQVITSYGIRGWVQMKDNDQAP